MYTVETEKPVLLFLEVAKFCALFVRFPRCIVHSRRVPSSLYAIFSQVAFLLLCVYTSLSRPRARSVKISRMSCLHIQSCTKNICVQKRILFLSLFPFFLLLSFSVTHQYVDIKILRYLYIWFLRLLIRSFYLFKKIFFLYSKLFKDT